MEKDKATLAIAKLVDETTYETVLAYILKNNTRNKMVDLETDWFYQAMAWWKDHALDAWKSAADVANEIADVCLVVETTSPYYRKEKRSLAWHLGKFLSRYPVIENRIKAGTMQYRMTKQIWQQVARARGFEQAFDLTDYSPPTTPNQPNQPYTPNTPTIENKKPKNAKTPQNHDFKEKSGGLGVFGGEKSDKLQKKKPTKKIEKNIGICAVCNTEADLNLHNGRWLCSDCRAREPNRLIEFEQEAGA